MESSKNKQYIKMPGSDDSRASPKHPETFGSQFRIENDLRLAAFVNDKKIEYVLDSSKETRLAKGDGLKGKFQKFLMMNKIESVLSRSNEVRAHAGKISSQLLKFAKTELEIENSFHSDIQEDSDVEEVEKSLKSSEKNSNRIKVAEHFESFSVRSNTESIKIIEAHTEKNRNAIALRSKSLPIDRGAFQTDHRYFGPSDLSSLKCKMCRGNGHSHAFCPMRKEICICCLEFHSFFKCGKLLKYACLNCGSPRHCHTMCPLNIPPCPTCQKSHQENTLCPFICFNEESDFDTVQGTKSIRCLRCNQFGHVSCDYKESEGDDLMLGRLSFGLVFKTLLKKKNKRTELIETYMDYLRQFGACGVSKASQAKNNRSDSKPERTIKNAKKSTGKESLWAGPTEEIEMSRSLIKDTPDSMSLSDLESSESDRKATQISSFGKLKKSAKKRNKSRYKKRASDGLMAQNQARSMDNLHRAWRNRRKLWLRKKLMRM